MGEQLDFVKLAKEDYEKAKENIIKAEEKEGKGKAAEELIEETKKYLESFEKSWLEYERNKDDESLKEAVKSAREAVHLSIDAVEKAQSVDLSLGMKVVWSMATILVIVSGLFVITEWSGWFEGYIWVDVIFFSLFGVLTNLAYAAAKHVREKDFDKTQKGWYISKIVQAPFITLAVVLILRNMSVEAINMKIDLRNSSRQVIIAVSYIMGYFSRRTLAYLERIKDWIMPPPTSAQS